MFIVGRNMLLIGSYNFKRKMNALKTQASALGRCVAGVGGFHPVKALENMGQLLDG